MRGCLWPLGIAFLALSPNLHSQAVPDVSAYISSPRRALVAPEMPEMQESWVSNSLLWANAIFTAFPPAVNESPVRRPALQRLDDVFHMQSAASRPSIRTFLRNRIDAALTQMEHDDAADGTKIWKLYNAGFVVRSGGVTVGFDLIPGVPGSDCVVSDEQLARLVSQVDILFISHWHPDHANSKMAELFLRAGKPVIVPPDLWVDQPFAKQLTYLERSSDHVSSMSVGRRKINIVAYPGHQGPVLNNVYFVQFPNKFEVLHTGDQDLPSDQGADRMWLGHIGEQHRIDAMLVDCWYENMNELVGSVRPNIVITGHEDELAHEIAHREDYTQTYERLERSPRPFVVMTWGELINLGAK
jgi:L-ascorbate metabolism protein UlaG (beta-lactamase superfamily)